MKELIKQCLWEYKVTLLAGLFFTGFVLYNWDYIPPIERLAALFLTTAPIWATTGYVLLNFFKTKK